jgi:hypothetical protein
MIRYVKYKAINIRMKYPSIAQFVFQNGGTITIFKVVSVSFQIPAPSQYFTWKI